MAIPEDTNKSSGNLEAKAPEAQAEAPKTAPAEKPVATVAADANTDAEKQKTVDASTETKAATKAAEKEAAEEMSTSLVDRLKKTFNSYVGLWDKFVQYEGEDQNRKGARLRLMSTFVTGVEAAFEREQAKLDKLDKNSGEYKKGKVALDNRIEQADKTLDAYLKVITEKNGKGLSNEALAQAVSQATKIVDLMTSSELSEAGMDRVLAYVLDTGDGTQKESFELLSKAVTDKDKQGYATTMLVLMSSDDRVAFAKTYLEKNAQGDGKKLLIDLNKIGGISPREIDDALKGSKIEGLTPEELKTCQENWEKLGEFRDLAERIGHDDYGAYNIGEAFNFKNLGTLLLKAAGLLNIVLSGVLHTEDFKKGDYAKFFGSMGAGAAMVAGGSALDSDGKLHQAIDAKSEAAIQRDARENMLKICDNSVNGWYRFFDEPASVSAFYDYVGASKNKSSDKLKKESLSTAEFETFLSTGGKPEEKPEEKKDDEEEKEPDVDYEAKKKEYEPVTPKFTAMKKEGAALGVTDKSLQDLGEIFDVLKIDKSNYQQTLDEAKKEK